MLTVKPAECLRRAAKAERQARRTSYEPNRIILQEIAAWWREQAELPAADSEARPAA